MRAARPHVNSAALEASHGSDRLLSQRMSAEDASFLYFEKPDAPLHIGSVGIYEGTIPFEEMYASMDARMHLIPRYRQRAIIPPLYAGHPTWEDDPEFSLDRHLRLVQLPAPGTREQLLRVLQRPLRRDAAARPAALGYHRDPRTRGWPYGLSEPRAPLPGRRRIGHRAVARGARPRAEPGADAAAGRAMAAGGAARARSSRGPTPCSTSGTATCARSPNGSRTFSTRGARCAQMTEFGRAMQVALPAAMRRPAATPWNKPISGKRRVACDAHVVPGSARHPERDRRHRERRDADGPRRRARPIPGRTRREDARHDVAHA